MYNTTNSDTLNLIVLLFYKLVLEQFQHKCSHHHGNHTLKIQPEYIIMHRNKLFTKLVKTVTFSFCYIHLQSHNNIIIILKLIPFSVDYFNSNKLLSNQQCLNSKCCNLHSVDIMQIYEGCFIFGYIIPYDTSA